MTKRNFPSSVSQAELDAAQYFQNWINRVMITKEVTLETEMLMNNSRVELPANVAHIVDTRAPKWLGMYKHVMPQQLISEFLEVLDKIKNNLAEPGKPAWPDSRMGLHKTHSFSKELQLITSQAGPTEHRLRSRLCTLFRLAGTPQHHHAKSFIVRFDEALAAVEKLEMRMTPSAPTRKIYSTFSAGSMIQTARHDDDNRLLFVLNMFNYAEKMMREANAEIHEWLSPKEASGRYVRYQHGDPAAMVLMNRIRMEFMDNAARAEETIRSFEHIRLFARYNDVSPVRIWEKVIEASDIALRRPQVNTIVQSMMELERKHSCEVFLNDFTNFMEHWTKIMWKSHYYYPFDSMDLIFARFEDEPEPA